MTEAKARDILNQYQRASEIRTYLKLAHKQPSVEAKFYTLMGNLGNKIPTVMQGRVYRRWRKYLLDEADRIEKELVKI